jgi:hypothetical protein
VVLLGGRRSLAREGVVGEEGSSSEGADTAAPSRCGVVSSSRNSKDSDQGSGPRHVLVEEIGWPPRAMAKLLWHLLKRLATGKGHQTHSVWGSLPHAAIANFNLRSRDPCTLALALPCIARWCVRSPRRTRWGLLGACCQACRLLCCGNLRAGLLQAILCMHNPFPSRCADAPSRDTAHYLHQAHSPTRVPSAFSWLPLLAG